MFSFLLGWISPCINSRVADDLRRHNVRVTSLQYLPPDHVRWCHHLFVVRQSHSETQTTNCCPYLQIVYHAPTWSRCNGKECILWMNKFHTSSVECTSSISPMIHSEKKCAHFCCEWSIVGYGTGVFWNCDKLFNCGMCLTVLHSSYTSLTPGICLSLELDKGTVSGPENGGISHWRRAPTIHCYWGNPNLCLDQPIWKGWC